MDGFEQSALDHLRKEKADLVAMVLVLRSALKGLLNTSDHDELIAMQQVIPVLAGDDVDGNGVVSLAAVNAMLASEWVNRI